MDKIQKNLYLGGGAAVIIQVKRKEPEIARVICCASDCLFCGSSKLGVASKFSLLRIADRDIPDTLVNIGKVQTFIDEGLEANEGVLLHCHAGENRSAAVLAAYLMQKQPLRLQQTVELLRRCRPSVNIATSYLSKLG